MESMLDYDYFDMVCHLDPPKKSNNRPSPDVNDGFHVFPTGAGAALGDWRKRMSHIVQDFFSSSRRRQGCMLYVFGLGTNAGEGKKDKQDGIFFDRNRLKPV
ncbi:hypothetical protein [Desulfosarcina ovata]|uniref:hypothetical protein n=1 Tax=Desulfosarcina ovata TaxID=83564 RepID=UPI0012D2E7BE|nr:hypothetical protein [Desulfosarcina ovata]